MTSIHVQHGAAAIKRNWTFFELLLLAPFGLLLWYIATEPLVISKKVSNPTLASAVPATPAQESVPLSELTKPTDVMQSTPRAPTEEERVVFVTTGNTSVLQRIAPVASVNLEAGEAIVAAAVEQAVAPVEAAPIEDRQSPAISAPHATRVGASRIEISDGTGIEGFAKGVAEQLEQAGISVSATGGLEGAQKRTVILFRDGYEEEAARLSQLFARPPVLVNNTKTRKPSDTADVRLVLGSAAAREKVLFALKGEAQKL